MPETKELSGKVLLVDDEESIREALGELLTVTGFTVDSADCVDSAIALLEKRSDIECIICDLKMPDRPGTELLHWLNETKRDIPLIFLTGFGTLETCQEAVREGAFDYILKPIDDKDKIMFPLKHAIDQRRLEARNKELQMDILRMAEEHQDLVDLLLNDAKTKAVVEEKIKLIVDKWK